MAAISYRISPKSPRQHLFEVTLTIAKASKDQEVWLPSWIPGSYLIREFARHIVTVSASLAGTGVPVAVQKTHKDRWQVACAEGADVVITSTVYAWDLSVRAAHLDQTHAFFNGPSVFFAVAGRELEAVEVHIDPPEDEACKGWKVATTLPAVDVRATGPTGGFGVYQAADYDELCDHPVEMGTFDVVEFEAGGVPHQMAVTGRTRFASERLAKDLKAICDTHVRLFHPDGKAPVDRYLFLTTAVGDGYGGLEHRASTALLCKRDDLPSSTMEEPTDGYRAFLGLCSHEYFHTWNVKRIKPAAYSPYRLNEENYTRQLWAFEGITSYYDDLGLVRAGVISVESWLELLGRTTTRVMRWAGRSKQNLADASFDAWIKYYRQDENSPNALVSYYTKGALLALATDLTIRDATDDAKSLDDVMRALFARYGDNASGQGTGVPEGGVEAVASEIAGVDLSPFFDEYLRGTNDIPLAGLLTPFGITTHLRALDGDSDQGGKPGKKETPLRGTLDVSVGGGGDGGAALSVVHDGGAAQAAGLSAGDIVVAVDGLKVGRATFARAIGQRAVGERVHLHFFRRDELMEADVVLEAPIEKAAWFELDANASAAIKTRRQQWLTPTAG